MVTGLKIAREIVLFFLYSCPVRDLRLSRQKLETGAELTKKSSGRPSS